MFNIMKISKINASSVSFTLLIALALSSQLIVCAKEDQKFFISKEHPTAKALVDESKEFTVTFEPSLASNVDYYESEQIFDLTIGLCKINIVAQKRLVGQKNIVSFDITDPSLSKLLTVNDPDGFTVTTKEVKFDGIHEVCKTGVEFKNHPTDTKKFLVEVKIEGNFPASLVLKSDALLYVDPNSKESNDNKEVLPIWAWILIAVGVILILILAIVAVVVPICVVKRRNQKLAHQSEPILQAETKKQVGRKESKEHAPVKQATTKKDKQITKEPAKTGKKSAEGPAKTDKKSTEGPAKVSKVSQVQQKVPAKTDKIPGVQKQASASKSKLPQTKQPSSMKNPTDGPSKKPEPPVQRIRREYFSTTSSELSPVRKPRVKKPKQLIADEQQLQTARDDKTMTTQEPTEETKTNQTQSEEPAHTQDATEEPAHTQDATEKTDKTQED